MNTLSDLTITVKIHDLLILLRENRTAHEKEHKAAVREYRKRAIEALEDKLTCLKAENWEVIRPDKYLHFSLPAPRSYAHVYTEVIDMLEMATEKEVTISSYQFRRWVKDDWDWSHDFKMSNAGYV